MDRTKEFGELVHRLAAADWSDTKAVRAIIREYSIESFWDLTDDRKLYEENDVLLFMIAALTAGRAIK